MSQIDDLKEGDVFGKGTVTKVNVEPFMTELTCVCGNTYRKPNSKVKVSKSCGQCPRICIMGQQFGKWTVTGWDRSLNNKSTSGSFWEVTCSCGTKDVRSSRTLRKGVTTHCGCSPSHTKPKDITGKKLGRLTAISITEEKTSNGDYIWNFQCECGSTVKTSIGYFNSGQTKSCGCLVKDEIHSRENYHGMKHTSVYNSWRKMRERCNDPNDPLFTRYGGRGVKVCKEWDESFQQFYRDMGTPPDGFTIDRIDLRGDYTPNNCRWGSRYVQSRNRGSSVGTSKYKGVQWEESSGKWIATITVGHLKCKKIGRYFSEETAAKAYNLASEMIFGQGDNRLELNPVDRDYSKVKMNCKFFRYWVHEMRNLQTELYED